MAAGIQLAMETPFGSDAEDGHKLLAKHGVSSRLAEKLAGERTSYTVFVSVDALTQNCRALRERR